MATYKQPKASAPAVLPKTNAMKHMREHQCVRGQQPQQRVSGRENLGHQDSWYWRGYKRRDGSRPNGLIRT
jgi:hypothetical protein